MIRGQRVILDADLARLYGVPTKRVNEAIKRNHDRFPQDFAFRVTANELVSLRSQFAAAGPLDADQKQVAPNWSQFATSSSRSPDWQRDRSNSSQFATRPSRHRGATYLPWAFTEHGALMAANILRSPRAV
jgi:hypothetical protein